MFLKEEVCRYAGWEGEGRVHNSSHCCTDYAATELSAKWKIRISFASKENNSQEEAKVHM